MRCEYSYQLASPQCASLNKQATLTFTIYTENNVEIISVCPVCANILEDKLLCGGFAYKKESEVQDALDKKD